MFFRRGFTLIEAVIGIGIAAVIIAGVLGVYSSLSTAVKVNREKTIVTNLAKTNLELVRNLPYSQVGTINGNPSGSLPDFANATTTDILGTVYSVYYEVTYIDDPADGTILAGTDSAPNDYKQVKMSVENTATGRVDSFLTSVAPKGLEGLVGGGALLIKVFNSSGVPVGDAQISISNNTLAPPIILSRSSDADGEWIEVGLPESVNGYHIVVTKAGYTTDQTYPITIGNPNPIKPDATIQNGVVTEVSFEIDLFSDLTIRTLNQLCQNVNGVDVNVKGAKLIGTAPDVLKFDQDLTSSNGSISINDIEWDTYTPTLLDGQGLMLYGTDPVQSINVLPGTSQVFTLILGPQTTNSLLVIVKDGATGNLLEGATVHLRLGGSTPQDYYGTTGGSVWVQYDWTGGPGQESFTDGSRYWADDGKIDINSVPTGVRLKKVTGRYLLSGELESSTYDTGTASTDFSTIVWEPSSQHPATVLKLQIASGNSTSTWTYLGPDGTTGTYYTVSGTTINSIHDGDRYIRYKAYLSTVDNKHTPVLTSLLVNYVSGCSTPGQVMFPGLTGGNNYNLTVTLTGYQDVVIPSMTIFDNEVIEVLMTP